MSERACPGGRCSCVIQRDDDEGKPGTKIGREVMETAGKALKANITALGPLVLPLSEKLIFVGNLFARKARLDAPEQEICAHPSIGHPAPPGHVPVSSR